MIARRHEVCQDADMAATETVQPLDESVGYVLKQAQAALRSAMDEALRPHGLTVPQYSCLELLHQRPGVSNAELARGAFVSRQAMHGVLRGLEDRAFVRRPVEAEHGRERPAMLTASGEKRWRAASEAVASVERTMIAPLSVERRRRLLKDLFACVGALTRTD
jgi:DNA-binding MarR family transcriptional regulator